MRFGGSSVDGSANKMPPLTTHARVTSSGRQLMRVRNFPRSVRKLAISDTVIPVGTTTPSLRSQNHGFRNTATLSTEYRGNRMDDSGSVF